MAGHHKWSEIKRKALSPEQLVQIDVEAASASREIEEQRERAARGIYRIAHEVDDDEVMAWVEGTPVATRAATREEAERAITGLLSAYKKEHPITPSNR